MTRSLGLIVALIVCTPAAAAVSGSHDPNHQGFSRPAHLPIERIQDVASHGAEPRLPLECRGYNVPGKSYRAPVRSLTRCE